MLKGLDTFNIPLDLTINNLPPSLHHNLAPSIPAHAEIDIVRHLAKSDLALTGSKTYGSVNVWSTKLGMHLLGGYNFLDELHKLQGSEEVKFKLKHMHEYNERDVHLYLRNHKVSDKTVALAKPAEAQV